MKELKVIERVTIILESVENDTCEELRRISDE